MLDREPPHPHAQAAPIAEAAPDHLGSFTADQFHAAVLACSPRTAAFDCDGTLWAPDAGYGFMQWSLEQKLIPDDRIAWLQDRYRLYEAGAADEAAICGEMVQVYKGLPVEKARAAAAVYFREHVAPHIFPEMVALIKALHAAGTQVWAVSSTCNWVIEAGVWASGLSVFRIPPPRILAAEVAIASDGLITDRLLAVPTDQAKADALQAAGLPHPDVVFGNSIHDEAMLSAARRAFPVNANQALAQAAGSRGWRTFAPARARPPLRQP